MTRGRLGTYMLRYQLRDFAILRAALPTVMTGFVAFMIFKTDARQIDWTSPRGQRMLADIMQFVIAAMYIGLAGFLGIARLITDDRANGYFRFLFSKPVSIERFYVQQWLLHGVGFVLLTGGLTLWIQANSAALPVVGAMQVMGLTWMLIGGVGFFLSALTNYDALLLVMFFIVSKVLHAIKDVERTPMWPWLQQVTRLTMPTHKLTHVQAEIFAGNPAPVPHTVHILAYGILAVTAGVVLLRRRSFAQ